MILAEPPGFPLAIFLMKLGTSMCVGQALVHGASKQYRQRLASTSASRGPSGGWISAKLAANCCSLVITSCGCQRAVHVGPPVAEELPGLPHFRDQVQIQIRGQNFVAVAGCLGDDLAARVAKVT